jgi:hypothetical protein
LQPQDSLQTFQPFLQDFLPCLHHARVSEMMHFLPIFKLLPLLPASPLQWRTSSMTEPPVLLWPWRAWMGLCWMMAEDLAWRFWWLRPPTSGELLLLSYGSLQAPHAGFAARLSNLLFLRLVFSLCVHHFALLDLPGHSFDGVPHQCTLPGFQGLLAAPAHPAHLQTIPRLAWCLILVHFLQQIFYCLCVVCTHSTWLVFLTKKLTFLATTLCFSICSCACACLFGNSCNTLGLQSLFVF